MFYCTTLLHCCTGLANFVLTSNIKVLLVHLWMCVKNLLCSHHRWENLGVRLSTKKHFFSCLTPVNFNIANLTVVGNQPLQQASMFLTVVSYANMDTVSYALVSLQQNLQCTIRNDKFKQMPQSYQCYINMYHKLLDVSLHIKVIVCSKTESAQHCCHNPNIS